jgi:hypothetical protein
MDLLHTQWFEMFEVDPGDVQEGEKRQYMPWALRWRCEKCGGENIKDFSSDYLSYPKFGVVNAVQLACGKCDAEHGEPSHTISLIPRLTLEVAPRDD